MSTAATPPERGGTGAAGVTAGTNTTDKTTEKPDRSELGIVALLVVMGAVVLYNASQLSTNIAQSGAVGPKVVPTVVGILLLVVAAFLAVDVFRGVQGDQEGGEDVDLTTGTDWKTVALLSLAFLSNAVLIDRVGWPVSGAIMFFVAAYALGSRHLFRDPIIAVAMSVGTWYLFVLTLGINLPVGVLKGIL